MRNFEFNRSIIFLFYARYKDYIVPIVTIIISFILLVLFTIPQISSLSERQQEVKFEREKLSRLQNNYSILSNLNDSTLNSQLTITSDALPSTKNFSGILNTISLSANKSGIFLGDFEFKVGDLSNPTIPAKGFPNLELSLSIKGNVSSIAKFINQLYQSLPLAEVTKIELGGNQAQLNTLFYFKPFLEKNVDGTVELSPLDKNDFNIIKEISSWNNPGAFGEVQLFSPPSSSSSASPSAF